MPLRVLRKAVGARALTNLKMLLGVRAEVAKNLARRGERIRLYLPFGHDWWPYAMRRIGENPYNAWLLRADLDRPDL